MSKTAWAKFWLKVMGNVKEVMEWTHPVLTALMHKVEGKSTDQEKEVYYERIDQWMKKQRKSD